YCLNRMPAGKPETAIKYHEAAIKAGFATAEVYNNLGYSYQLRNNPKEARKALDRAIELDANLQAAYHNRAFVTRSEIMPKAPKLKPNAKSDETYRVLKSGIADAQKAIAMGA